MYSANNDADFSSVSPRLYIYQEEYQHIPMNRPVNFLRSSTKAGEKEKAKTGSRKERKEDAKSAKNNIIILHLEILQP
jgi:hypothetical protein